MRMAAMKQNANHIQNNIDCFANFKESCLVYCDHRLSAYVLQYNEELMNKILYIS